MKKLYLVDVSSMFFRAFYAIPPLRTSQGLPTNALYGFLTMSIKLLRENRPDYMVYCFDRKEASFRSEIYPEYKANRSEMPEDLSPQVPYIRELTEKLGITAIDKLNYEADDVIGTLALRGAAQNLDVSIVSGDKDFAQLVGPRVSLFDTMKNVRYDRSGVVEKWGVEAEQMIDYLAIVGDSSDNIPGIKGVGPKGAQKLLAEYKTLENIYVHIDEIKSESLRKKLIESKDAAFLARRLVTIATDIELPVSFDDLKLKPIHKEELKVLLDKLEFGAVMRKLFNENSNGSQSSQPQQQQLDLSDETNGDQNAIARLAASADPANRSSSQRSATGPSPDTSPQSSRKKITAVKSLSLSVGTKIKPFAPTQWTLSELKKNVQPYKEIWGVNTSRGFCLGYDGKAIQVDARLEEIGEVLGPKMLGWRGFDVKSLWQTIKLPQTVTPKWDSMLAAYVVKAGAITDFSEVYAQYVGEKIPELASPEDILNCELRLEAALQPRLHEAHGMKVLENLELPLVPVLYDMETHGILINKAELKEQSLGLNRDVQKLEKEIHNLAGESFNIGSPKQLAVILFDKLKIPSGKKTKTGFSTDSDVLSKLALQHPICALLLQYRELTKLQSTYVDALPDLIDPKDGRLHTHFHQAVTQTGRLSSTNPNLQNIPIRTERGRAIRKAFIAKEGSVLLSADYSQIELRVLAEITGDPGLTEAFKKNQDIHAATASEVFNVPINEVTPDQRRMAKAVNFGIAYGQGVFGLAETLEVPQSEAKRIIENYFIKFKKVKEYMLETVNLAKERGYAETIFGRRRYIDEFQSASGMVRKFGERAAINAPIQGTASDLMKKAMIRVHESSPATLLLQVHDELLLECPRSQVEDEAHHVKQIMESIVDFNVPLGVNVAWGDTWENAHA